MERHPVDVVALGFGAVFAVLAGLALGGGLDDPSAAAWLVPVALAAVALGLVVTSLRRRRTPTDDADPHARPPGQALG